jgi:integrase/recombinase XerD
MAMNMAGKQAKPIADREVARLLALLGRRRYSARDRAILLLSLKAGLRAGEIAGLTWRMLLDARAEIANAIELADDVAKKGSGRTIPLHPQLRDALVRLKGRSDPHPDSPVLCSERGGRLRASSVVNWFAALYRQAGLDGCSSHSGRRTFITKAARLIHRVGGSLRDVQQLAGHRSIEMTQRYIEGDTKAKRALVKLV